MQQISGGRLLHRVMFYNMMVVIFVAFAGCCALLVIGEINLVGEETTLVRNEYRRQFQDLMRVEVLNALEQIKYAGTSMDERLRTELKERVSQAVTQAQAVFDAGTADGLAPEQIRRMIVAALRSPRFFHGRGHYFMAGLDGVSLLLPERPDLEGHNLLQDRENSGMSFTGELIALVRREKQGFYPCDVVKPGGTSKKYAKLIYVRYFPPLDCFIGAGEYLDDFRNDLQAAVVNDLERVHLRHANYLFFVRYDGICLLGPGRGTNVLEAPNQRAADTVRLLIQKARSGGGFVEYRMPEIEGAAPRPKLSYVLPVPGDESYLGAGIYLDRMDQELAEREQSMKDAICRHVLVLAGLFALVMGGAILMARRFSGHIRRSVSSFSAQVYRTAREGEPLNAGVYEFCEFRQFAEEVNRLLDERRRSEEQYRLLLENSPVATAVSALSGEVLFLNHDFQNLFGYTTEQVKTVEDWMRLAYPDPLYRSELRQKWEAAMAGAAHNQGRTPYHTARATTADGRVVEIRASAAVCENRVIVMFEDQTEIVRTRQELERAQALLHAAIENSPAGIVIADAPGMYIRLANPAFCRLAGLESAPKMALNAAGGEFLRLRHDDGSACEPQELPLSRSILDGEEVRNKSAILVGGHGDERVVLINAAPIRGNDGAVIAGIMVLLDITEQHKMELLLRQSQKMDAIGQLAGGVAHDFNNTLGGIIGATELLKFRFADNPEAERLLNIILTAAARAADLTAKLLAFSRKQPSLIGPLDFHQVIADAVAILQNTIDKRIRIVVRPDAPKSVLSGDHAQLQNVLLNLGINAAHAMPDGGELCIGTHNVRIPALFLNARAIAEAEGKPPLAPGEYLEVTVKDTGVGIPPEIADRIFEPFFTTKEIGKGTGLGLAAVLGTVQQHQGEITVRSQPGAGACFTILFPLAEQAEVILPALEGELRSGEGKVLVVDDEEMMRQTAGALLKQFGYDVLYAENGRDAVEVFRSYRQEIDLVLLDMIMPEMNGRDCFQAMRALRPDVKVILCSGFTPEADWLRMQEDGVCGYLRKPFRASELNRLVLQVIRNHP